MSSIDSTSKDPVEIESESTTTDTDEDAHTQTDQPQKPPVDVIFEILKNERRRRVIEYLREHGEPAELGAVAEHIAALENDKDKAAITYAERKRVYVGLYQCHLPKMDDMGVVEFNRSRGLIELTDQTQYLEAYLDGPAPAAPWYRYYGAVALGSLALFVLTVVGLGPAILTPQVALGATLVAMAACTGAHYATEVSTAV